jgi:peptidoglycan/LPS O-acetylase OafA/YrhL
MGAYFLHQEETPPAWLKSSALSGLGFILLSGITLALWNYGPQALDAVRPCIAGLSFFCLLNLLRLWDKPPLLLCTIGRVSFSMYLFHFIFAKVLLVLILKSVTTSVSPDIMLIVSFLSICSATLALALNYRANH